MTQPFSHEDIDGHRPQEPRRLPSIGDPIGVDFRGVPHQHLIGTPHDGELVGRFYDTPAKELRAPTRDPRVEWLQRLSAIRRLLAVICEEVDEFGGMLCLEYGDPRNQAKRVRQPGPTVCDKQHTTQTQAAWQAAREAQKRGPVGGPGSSLR